jgi:hypothetical protein
MAGRWDILFGWLICTIIFITPNVIFQIMTVACSDRAAALTCSFVEAILTDFLVSANIVCGFIMAFCRTGTPETDDRYAFAQSVLIAVAVVYVVWIICRLECCCDCCDRFLVVNQLRHPVQTPFDGFWGVGQNAAAPPLIEISVWSGHWESCERAQIWEAFDRITTEPVTHTNLDGTTRVEIKQETEHVNRPVRSVTSKQRREDQGGGHFDKLPEVTGFEYVKSIDREKEIITTWEEKEFYKYESWDDTTVLPDFPDVMAVTCEAVWNVQVTASARTEIDAMKERFTRAGREKDTDVKVKETVVIPRGVEEVSFALNEAEVGRVRRDHANCRGRLTWQLAWLIGFHSCYECFCSLGEQVSSGTGTAVKVEHYKIISAGKEKRCAYNTPDDKSRSVTMDGLRSLHMITYV